MTTARESLSRIVGAIQSSPQVQSVWLGGSVRDNTDDEVSDLDLWVVTDDWCPQSLAGLLIAGKRANIGDYPLFHGVDIEGVIVDICHGPLPPDYYSPLDRMDPAPWYPGRIEDSGIYTDFWLNSYKNRKPLWRKLDAMVVFGLHYDRLALTQAWVRQDTGVTPEAHTFSIHGLAPIIRDHITPERRELLCLPTRTRSDLLTTIYAYRHEMQKMSPPNSLLKDLVMDDPLFMEMLSEAV